ncbi:TPA: hypothetical protein QDZ42_000012 [Stenotrophomonas maltophilia]|nr:hypothetical protein [Stenotrophomonas maltophilia]HDS1041418.1 hypothetical protein [Stenotrophomonas maltophilia]
MRDPQSNVLEFIAGCAVDADIYYLAAAIGPGNECYDPDPGPPSRMFIFGRTPEEEWFHHDLQDFQVMATQLVPEHPGRPRRVLALDFYGQLEDYSRAGSTTEYVSAEGAEFPGGLVCLRLLGDDLFCGGTGGQIHHRGPDGWQQLPAHLAAALCDDYDDDSELDDFDSWLDSFGYLFELNDAPTLPTDPMERDAELRRRFDEWRAHMVETQKDGGFNQLLGESRAGIVNDLSGTGFADLYAIGTRGLIAHWDGSRWQMPEKVTTSHLVQAVMTEAGNMLVVGHQATIVLGNMTTGFECLPHEISEDVNFYCACQHGQAIYIGSENGIYVYSPSSRIIERLKSGLPEEVMDAAVVDISSAGGVLWVLTPWDLVRFDGSHWQVIVHPDNG